MKKIKNIQNWVLGLIIVHWILVLLRYFFTYTSINIFADGFILKPVSFSEIGPILMVLLVISPMLWIIPLWGIIKKAKWAPVLTMLFAVVLIFRTFSGFSGIDYSIYLVIVSLGDLVVAFFMLAFSVVFLKRLPEAGTEEVS